MNNFCFKGSNKRKNYFEGWYLKVVDSKSKSNYAFIFGISLYKDDPHSFIQIISNNDDNSYYFRFDISDFYYNNNSVRIKDNILGMHQLKLKVGSFDINLNIKPTIELKNYFLTNSAMGCIKYLPLPAYHEIVFMDSKVEGTIKDSNSSKEINGSGYMEKNWGSCFPKKWLWLQSNDFNKYNASIVLAVADIFGKKGFFCILNVDGEELRFATYNFFKVSLEPGDDEARIIIDKKNIRLVITVKTNDSHIIIGPERHGKMAKEITESLTGTLTISLYRNDELIFNDSANNVGCEILY